MKYLPVGLDVRRRTCIVVGGGQIGTRKIVSLLEAGAKVILVSPAASDRVAHLAETGRLRWQQEEYREDVLDGAFLAVAATDDQDLNKRLVEDARDRGVLVCDASSATRSEVIFGALHRTEGITLAVFTDGKNPSLARRTRDRIASLDGEWEEK